MIYKIIYLLLIHRALYCFPQNTPRRSTETLTCELRNISPVTEHCVCKLCLHRRHPRYHFGNTNLNITTNKSSNKKIFGIQLFTLHRIHISSIVFGFIGTSTLSHSFDAIFVFQILRH